MVTYLFYSHSGRPLQFSVQADLPPALFKRIVNTVNEYGGTILPQGEYPPNGFVLVDPRSKSGREIHRTVHDLNRVFVVHYAWVDLCVAADEVLAPYLRHPPAFTHPNGSPLKVFIKRDSFNHQAYADALHSRVLSYGAVILDRPDGADIVLANEQHASFRKLVKRDPRVHGVAWANEKMKLVEDDVYEEEDRATVSAIDEEDAGEEEEEEEDYNQFTLKGVEGILNKKRNPGMARNPFTPTEIRHLVNYIAEQITFASLSGNILYRPIIHLPWGGRHTTSSWRERYVRHKKQMNPHILDAVKRRYDKMDAKEQRRFCKDIKMRCEKDKIVIGDKDSAGDVEFLGDVNHTLNALRYSTPAAAAWPPKRQNRRKQDAFSVPDVEEIDLAEAEVDEMEDEEQEEGEEEEEEEEEEVRAGGTSAAPDMDADAVEEYVQNMNHIKYDEIQEHAVASLSPSPPPLTGPTLVQSPTQPVKERSVAPSPSPPPPPIPSPPLRRVTRASSREPQPLPAPVRQKPKRQRRPLAPIVDVQEKEVEQEHHGENEDVLHTSPRADKGKLKEQVPAKRPLSTDDEDARLLLEHRSVKNATISLTARAPPQAIARPARKRPRHTAPPLRTFSPQRRNFTPQKPLVARTYGPVAIPRPPSAHENDDRRWMPAPQTRARALVDAQTPFRPLEGTLAAEARRSGAARLA